MSFGVQYAMLELCGVSSETSTNNDKCWVSQTSYTRGINSNDKLNLYIELRPTL